MSVAEVKANIVKCENDIEGIVTQSAKLRKEIVELVKPFAKEKIQDMVVSRVKCKPEITKSLSKEQLKDMKSELMDMVADSDRFVEQIYYDDKLWLHIGYELVSGTSPYDKGKVALENIHTGLRMVIGRAGRLLINFGYSEAPTTTQYSSQEWSLLDGKGRVFKKSLL